MGLIATPIGAAPVAQLAPQLIGVSEPLLPTEKGEIAFPVAPEPETYTWLADATAGRESAPAIRSRPISAAAMRARGRMFTFVPTTMGSAESPGYLSRALQEVREPPRRVAEYWVDGPTKEQE